MITQEIVDEFKARMHLDDDEDENLKSILEASCEALIEDCGKYDISNKRFKELVFERSRYVYNDALEYFYDNFLTSINNLSLKNALNEMDDTNETI